MGKRKTGGERGKERVIKQGLEEARGGEGDSS